jgi:hypothetical protein
MESPLVAVAGEVPRARTWMVADMIGGWWGALD